MGVIRIVLLLIATVLGANTARAVSTTELNAIGKRDGFVDFGPVAGSNSGPVSVVEFFAYGCSHCNAFEDTLNEWVQQQGKKIEFSRHHVSFSRNSNPQQRLFYALEQLGKERFLRGKILAEIHIRNNKLNTDEAVLAFLDQQRMEQGHLRGTYLSHEVTRRIEQANSAERKYRVWGVPALLVGGRFLIMPTFFTEEPGPIAKFFGRTHIAGSEKRMHAAVLRTAERLVAEQVLARSKQPQ